MNLATRLKLRLRGWFGGESLDRELDEELRFHIDMQTEENVRSGMSVEEARRRAVVLFGGLAGHREQARDERGPEVRAARVSWLDVKLGLRMLLRYPWLTLVGTLAITVAVGLGAAFFEFTEDMFAPTLPLPEGDRIVALRNWDLAAAAPDLRTLHDFEAWRVELRSVRDLSAFSMLMPTVSTEDGVAVTVRAAQISASGFALTRVPPLLGRPLIEADEEQDAPPVAVIGYDLWQRLFGGDPAVIGQGLRVGSSTSTVVGVMPEGFGFPINQELWIPFRYRALDHARGQGPPTLVFGRLAPGVTRREAQAELTAVGARTSALYPDTHARLQPQVVTFKELLAAIPVWMIQVVRFIFVLLMAVACANVATLVFARTVTRESEFAVRSALGASRRRILLQLFVEALVLTGVAAALGLAAAAYGLRRGMGIFWEVQEDRPPFWWNDALSGSTILYVVVLAIACATVVGVIPALKVTAKGMQPALRQLSAGTSGLGFGRIWTGVIVFQVALSVAFLPIAVLEARNLVSDPVGGTGFRADEYLTGRLVREADPLAVLEEAERAGFLARTGALQEEVKRRVAEEPGVTGVALASRLSGMNHPTELVQVETVGSGSFDREAGSRSLSVDPDFFGLMGARVLHGRAFAPGDYASASTAVMVNQSFVRDLFGGRNPVGLRLRYPDVSNEGLERVYEVVGVIGDLQMDEFGPRAHRVVYHPLRPGASASVQLFARTESAADYAVPGIRSLVAALDPAIRIDDLRPLDEVWAPAHRWYRIAAVITSLVAAIALLLSMAGVYALMSFTVSRRTREIGIRSALGARPRRLVASIFARALGQLAIGVVIGCAIAGFWLRANLDGDGLLVLVTVAGVLLAVGLVACGPPAARALRIQPTEALRGAA